MNPTQAAVTAGQRGRVSVVLVGARNPQNIGAAARAMQDFGFNDLRFVNDYVVPLEAAQAEAAASTAREGVKSGVGAGEVLRRARAFASVADAVSDCTLVVGTTAIGARQIEHTLHPITVAARNLREALGGEARVALLFGSEKTGLSNEQLSFCHWLTTVPLFAPEGERHLSMNLGQSVAVCLYELVREGFEGSRALPTQLRAAASGADRERLTQLLIETMDASGYARRFPANARETVVRRLAQGLGDSAEQAQTWMGIWKMVLAALRRQ